MTKINIAIVGTVGLPANYGGFETLAENLVIWSETSDSNHNLAVWCSTKSYTEHMNDYHGARLHYVPLSANGPLSIFYDVWSILSAIRKRSDVIILLGVSGSIVLPLIRLFSRVRIVTNIDGIEWKREKWSGIAKIVLRWLERLAIKYSDAVIADNQAIADYVTETYSRSCNVIAYGGDHALQPIADISATANLPDTYALALCRIEPENNIEMILLAYSALNRPLLFVGNWDRSEYGRALKDRYKGHPHIIIHDPVYDPSALRAIRQKAIVYLHGHSAGGTNPSLVEMMHFGIPVITHGCLFNRFTTQNKARYFMSAEELASEVRALSVNDSVQIGNEMAQIAQRHYTWNEIARSYFALAEGPF